MRQLRATRVILRGQQVQEVPAEISRAVCVTAKAFGPSLFTRPAGLVGPRVLALRTRRPAATTRRAAASPSGSEPITPTVPNTAHLRIPRQAPLPRVDRRQPAWCAARTGRSRPQAAGHADNKKAP